MTEILRTSLYSTKKHFCFTFLSKYLRALHRVLTVILYILSLMCEVKGI